MTTRWCWTCSRWCVPGETGPRRCACNFQHDDLPDKELADQFTREDHS